MSTKNARILGIRLDEHDAQRVAKFEQQTHIEGVSLARAALRSALDYYETTGTLTLPLKIVEAKTSLSQLSSKSGVAAECASTALSTSPSRSSSSPSAPAPIVTLPPPPTLGTVVHAGLGSPHSLNESTPRPPVTETRKETSYQPAKKPRRKNGTED